VSRPYLEVKVVKVKKCRHFLAKWTPGNIYKCCKCGKIVTERGHKPIKPKGNWVNLKFMGCYMKWQMNTF